MIKKAWKAMRLAMALTGFIAALSAVKHVEIEIELWLFGPAFFAGDE